jgi:3-oxoacyl-[acyl-carrier-protein] synthase II
MIAKERVGMRRVVITGMGIVCPLGHGLETVWRRLVNGRSGIRSITTFNTDLPSRVAGQVRSSAWGVRPEPSRADRAARLAQIAAAEAIQDAGWRPGSAEAQALAGVTIGSGCGALETLSEGARLPVGVGSAFMLRGMIHSIATDLAQHFGFLGPRRAVSTACSSGAHAIGDAARLVALGDAEVMLAGGTEAAVTELGMAGFAAARALSTGFNDTPQRASRPWDRERDGFVMGEGAGMVVLESLEHARARGARIHAELAGYGMSGDAWHITAPNESGDGAFRAMRNALRSAGLAPSDIGYINAHGTSTPAGDDIELAAVERLFGEAARHLAMSSTKSATGHLLGAAGAVEAIFSALALRDGVVPPTLNLDCPSRESPIDRIARTAQERPVRVAMSNSFGFGGTNASLVLRAP